MPREIRLAFWTPVAVLVLVLPLTLIVQRNDLGTTEYGFNIYYFLFERYEPFGALLGLIGAIATLAALRTSSSASEARDRRARPEAIWAVAVLVFGALWLGAVTVFHSYPFSMDEFATGFQAQVFVAGRLAAPVAEPWTAFGAALTPVFISYMAPTHTWISSYMPVYAALHAPFLAAGAAAALNPLLGALSMVLAADVARRLWPDQPGAGWVAACLLGTSSQFVLTSMSFYSMPAHLCANLLWVSLYLRNSRWSLALLPWVGGLALGLHQVVVHALFVAPFLLRILLTRKLATTAYIAAVYLGFCGLWLWWRKIAILIGESEHVARVFGLPGRAQALDQGINLTLLVSWQSAALSMLVVLALVSWRRWPSPLLDVVLGIVLTLVFYCFVLTQQGHGWGYRYFYGVLGNLVLLAVAGWLELSSLVGRTPALRSLIVSSVIALALQLPMRMFEAERMIAPFARARDYFASRPETVLVVDPRMSWYGQDLIRNDPGLPSDRPVIVNMLALRRGAPDALRKLGTFRVVGPRELATLGLTVPSLWLPAQ